MLNYCLVFLEQHHPPPCGCTMGQEQHDYTPTGPQGWNQGTNKGIYYNLHCSYVSRISQTIVVIQT